MWKQLFLNPLWPIVVCLYHTYTYTHFPSNPENRTLKRVIKFSVRLFCSCVSFSSPTGSAAAATCSCLTTLMTTIQPGLSVVDKAACGAPRASLFVLPCFHSRIPWMTTIQTYPSISGGQHEIFRLIGNWHFVGARTRSNIPTHKTSSRGQWEPNFVINHFLIWHFELFRFPFSAANSVHPVPHTSPPVLHCVGAFHAPLKFNRKSIFVANENSNNKIPTAAKTSSMFFSSSLPSSFVAQVRPHPEQWGSSAASAIDSGPNFLWFIYSKVCA